MKDLQVQLIRPPVAVGHASSGCVSCGSGLGAHHGAFTDVIHILVWFGIGLIEKLVGFLRCLLLRETVGTGAPIDHLRFVDLEPRIDTGGQTRGLADGAIDVDRFSTSSAD